MSTVQWIESNWIYLVVPIVGIISLGVMLALVLMTGRVIMWAWKFYLDAQHLALISKTSVLNEKKGQTAQVQNDLKVQLDLTNKDLNNTKSALALKDKLLIAQNENITNYRNQLQHVQADMDKLRKHLESEQMSLALSRSDSKQGRHELDKAQQEINDLITANNMLEQQLTAKEKSVGMLQSTVTDLNHYRDKTNMELEHLKDKIKSLEAALAVASV